MSCACIELGSLQLEKSTKEARAASRRTLMLSLFLKLQACIHNRYTHAQHEPVPLCSIRWFLAFLSSFSQFVTNLRQFLLFFQWASSVYDQAIVICIQFLNPSHPGLFVPSWNEPEEKQWVVHPRLFVQKCRLSNYSYTSWKAPTKFPFKDIEFVYN